MRGAKKRRMRKEKKNFELRRDAAGIELREVEGEERTLELSFSSETPYERGFGTEILDHGEKSVELKRLKELGCVLFNHNPDRVIGKVLDAWIDGEKCRAKVRFDSDAEAEGIYQKILKKTLTGVSVGYRVDVWEKVQEGKKSEDGRFKGPCWIAKRWTPYEISIVSVPADASVGIGRSMEGNEDRRSSDWFFRQLHINQEMAKEKRRSKE